METVEAITVDSPPDRDRERATVEGSAQHPTEDQECCIKCCWRWWTRRYTMNVRNISGAHALMIFTPTPITRITNLQVAKIGGATVQVEGSHKVQKFKLLHNKTRKVRVNTYGVYLTVFLRLNKEWCMLWSNRQFYAERKARVLLLQRHIDEAALELPSGPTLPELERQRHVPSIVLRTEV